MIYPLLASCLGKDHKVIEMIQAYLPRDKQCNDSAYTAQYNSCMPTLELWLCCCSAHRNRSLTAVQMMRVELTKFNKRFGIAKMAAKAYIGKDMCCEAELTLVMGR